ncbi:MAG: SCO family protein [Planctomycetota bacterium]
MNQHSIIQKLLACVVILTVTAVNLCVIGQEPAEISGVNLYGQNETPEVAEEIGVDSYTGEFIELDIPFNDEMNRYVKIGDMLKYGQPVILSFNYSNCPKLCSVQLQNMTLALREVADKYGLAVGDDFQVVSISMDPNEQTSRARETKQKYLTLYGDRGDEEGFHFLVGERKNIQLMADIVGFRFKYIADRKFYSHPPVFILISPKGKIVRYIHGLDYDPKTINLALIETAEGKIGSPINILSYGIGCYLFDESTGMYSFQAMAVMRIGGLITIAVLLFTLVPYWFFRKGGQSDQANESIPVTNPT